MIWNPALLISGTPVLPVRHCPTVCKGVPHKSLDEGFSVTYLTLIARPQTKGDFRVADLLGRAGPGKNQTFVQRICTEGR